MPLLPNAQNVVINNSHLTDLTVNNMTGPSGIDALLEASIPEAAHDSSARDPPPRCFPGTREQYVEDIINWALPAVGDTALPIYWIKGPAGVGKSAVAQTCVEKLQKSKKLGAAFFFSNNGRHEDVSMDRRNEHYKFFTSIAYQLSTVYPDYHDLIDKKIRRNKSLLDKTMEAQFWGLIVEPLQELEEEGKGVGKRIPVFVDGLDECESQDAQRGIIEIVTNAAREGATPLCWAFFSRPESHIEAAFSRASVSPLCYKAILPISRDADRDIELYLRAGFEDILRRRNVLMDSPWPSHTDMDKLVSAARGLFIYAKTLLRFVGQPDSLNPEELLGAIIALISRHRQSGTVAEPAFAELDAFYTLIMQRIPTKMFPTIHRLLGILSRSNYSSAIMIANLSEISRVELEIVCSQMSAVIHFQQQPKPLQFDPAIDTSRSFLHVNPGLTLETHDMIGFSLGGTISFYHKSFSDFLRDPVRSGVYYVGASAMKEVVEKRKWALGIDCEKGYYWQGSELIQTPNSSSSATSLSYPYQNELVNSYIKALFFRRISCESKPSGVDFDFRKQLYIAASIARGLSSSQRVSRYTLYECAGLRKYIDRTLLAWIQPGEFRKFNVAAFKRVIEKQQREGIVQPYNPTSAFVPDRPQERVESGLYTIGRDSRSIFWYWEINYDLKTYRELRTLDLVEGERLYGGEVWSITNKRMKT